MSDNSFVVNAPNGASHFIFIRGDGVRSSRSGDGVVLHGAVATYGDNKSLLVYYSALVDDTRWPRVEVSALRHTAWGPGVNEWRPDSFVLHFVYAKNEDCCKALIYDEPDDVRTGTWRASGSVDRPVINSLREKRRPPSHIGGIDSDDF